MTSSHVPHYLSSRNLLHLPRYVYASRIHPSTKILSVFQSVYIFGIALNLQKPFLATIISFFQIRLHFPNCSQLPTTLSGHVPSIFSVPLSPTFNPPSRIKFYMN